MANPDDLSPWPEPSHAEPQASLVGLGTENTPQIGLPEISPEEAEKAEKALLKKSQLGIYSTDELLEANGRKIVPDKANPHLGRDAETGAELARHSSGNWLQQGDADYEAARNAIGADDNSQQKTNNASNSADTTQNVKMRENLENFINKTVAEDLGSGHSHPVADAIAQQRLLAGVSDAELSKIAGMLAAVDGVAFAGTEEINPEKLGSMRPDPVGATMGEQSAYARAQAEKQKANEQFTLLDNARRRDSQT